MKFLSAYIISLAFAGDDEGSNLPPNDGKFLYTDVFTNHQGIHMVELQIGSTHQSMNLWLSTHDPKMSVVKYDASGEIDVPNKYNPMLSSSSVYVKSQQGKE